MPVYPMPSLPPGTRRIPAQLWDAGLEARRRLDAAAVEAGGLVERAREEAAAIRARAAAEGREDGVAVATELVARAALARDRLLAEAEPQLVALAFSIARTVLDRALVRDRGAVVELAARALEAVRHRAHVTLRAHPEDVAALREADPQLCAELERARCLAVVEDASVGKGGVLVETEAGTLDARVGPQLDALRRALDSALHVGPAPSTVSAGGRPCGEDGDGGGCR